MQCPFGIGQHPTHAAGQDCLPNDLSTTCVGMIHWMITHRVSSSTGFLSTKMQTWKTTFNIYTVENYKQSAILLDAWQLLVLAHPFEAMWCSSESGGSEAQRPVPRASSGFQVPPSWYSEICHKPVFILSNNATWCTLWQVVNGLITLSFKISECLCFTKISDKRAACRACVQW